MTNLLRSCFSSLVYFCSQGSDSTKCKYHGISPTCDDVTDRDVDITDEEKATIADKHNEYRGKMAA